MDGKFLPRAPWSPDGPAISANVPMMIGTTATETTALIGGNDPSVFSLDDASLRQRLSAWIPANEIDRVISGYRKSAPRATPSDLFFAVTTARRVRQHAWTQAERKAAQMPHRFGFMNSIGKHPSMTGSGSRPIRSIWPSSLTMSPDRSPWSVEEMGRAPSLTR